MVPNDSISNNKKETATSHEAKPRPKFRKWNSFQMPTDLQTPSPSDEKSENFKNSGLIAPYNHSGASPLSALKDEYNTRRPVVNTAMDMKTDNLFDSLMAKNSSTPEVKQKPSSIYQKMLHLAQSGVDSLKSLTETAGGAAANSSTNSPASNTNGNGNDEDNDDNDNGDDVDVDVDVELSSDDNEPSTSTILGGTPVKKSNEDDTQYPVDQLEDGINNEKLPEMQDLIKEIMDFKHDLGDKLEAKDPQKLTRTQQKLMDYKELHDFEAENPRPENMSSYKWKIQNETILSQYNNIRLRFSSREKPNSKKKKIENLSGVLGFVKRYGGNDDHHIDGINSGGPTIPTLATESKERKSMLQSMWDDEYSKNFVTTPLTDDS
ncbi:uncharacterized protein LODBEIA_P13050 [Lodderomyces beijingensis]|uniref:Uncharacterized protein n=1 Tax=Lodderomyces beijingensis TaxID=1775926 RepID=A0ABP0ZJP5_9ASCO